MFEELGNDDEIHHEMYLHVLWSTKNQQPLISPSWASHLCHFIEGLCDEKKWSVIASCAPIDHIQLLIKFTPDFILSDFLIELKTNTLIWIRTNFRECRDFEWQGSDFAFTISFETVGTLIDKMNNQKDPAKAIAFSDLIPIILDENQLEYSMSEVLE